MMNSILFAASVWRESLVTALRGLPTAFLLCLPAAVVAIPFTLTGHSFGPEAENPWLVWLGWLVLLTLALVPALSALLRRGAGEAGATFPYARIGADERRILIVIGLTGVLALTVVGVAFILFVAFLSALALASRAAANAPELAVEAAEHAPQIEAYFGTGEWVAAIVTGTAFALFSIWFVTRLSLAFPETIRLKKVQAMAALGLSRGRMFSVTLSGMVLTGLIGGLVWALRLVTPVEGVAGLVTVFAISLAGLATALALIAGFLTSLDAALVRADSNTGGT
ncbi:MAG TPA: hypothetical protein DCQ53_10500 [Alphaproteobacteria bacterium]|jgi:hypothetical protein|nr:hypothetical protein [Alphaproteobacteria bacterium]